MTHKEKCKLVEIHNAISAEMGDTDPDCDMTMAEIREEEPLLWASIKLAGMIGRGSWDKYSESNAGVEPRRGSDVGSNPLLGCLTERKGK